MSNQDIKDLIQIFLESSIAEMEVKRGENSLRLRRSFGTAPATEISLPQAEAQAHSHFGSPAPSAPQVSTPPPPVSEDIIVPSPIIGTYYDAPKPGDPPFVKVGDQVERGQVLCIIESMKLMNEINSEVAGTVAAKLIENGRPVEYGAALFSIRPR